MTTATTIPIIPKMFPVRDDSGCDKPLRANIKSIAEIKYKGRKIISGEFFLNERVENINEVIILFDYSKTHNHFLYNLLSQNHFPNHAF